MYSFSVICVLCPLSVVIFDPSLLSYKLSPLYIYFERYMIFTSQFQRFFCSFVMLSCFILFPLLTFYVVKLFQLDSNTWAVDSRPVQILLQLNLYQFPLTLYRQVQIFFQLLLTFFSICLYRKVICEVVLLTSKKFSEFCFISVVGLNFLNCR